jgi:hypothetical protein
MIFEQTAIHNPTSLLGVRQLSAIEVTNARPTGWRQRVSVTAEQASSRMSAVLGALVSWIGPSCLERAHRFCIATGKGSLRVGQRVVTATWSAYVNAHTVTLHNGRTVWIDEYQTFFLDADPCDDTSTTCDYDQWLQAQVWGW